MNKVLNYISPDIRIFPTPSYQNFGNNYTSLSSGLEFYLNSPKTAEKSYITELIKNHCYSYKANITKFYVTTEIEHPDTEISKVIINLNITNYTPYPQYPVDESYTINIPSSNTIYINATSTIGLMYSLDSLLQLILPSYSKIPFPTLISDKPNYNWRGVLIDTSRHYLPINKIKKIILGMRYSKYNILHWHITDGVSFPLKIRKYENITKDKLIWKNNEYYDKTMINDIINYAKSNGIRVVPEIDSPAHIGIIKKVFNDIICECDNKKIDYNNYDEMNKHVLNLTNPKTLELMVLLLLLFCSMIY